MNKNNSLLRGLCNLHTDEDGMEAIQVVALVAIAAIVLIFLKTTLWEQKVKKFAEDEVKNLTGN